MSNFETFCQVINMIHVHYVEILTIHKKENSRFVCKASLLKNRYWNNLLYTVRAKQIPIFFSSQNHFTKKMFILFNYRKNVHAFKKEHIGREILMSKKESLWSSTMDPTPGVISPTIKAPNTSYECQNVLFKFCSEMKDKFRAPNFLGAVLAAFRKLIGS